MRAFRHVIGKALAVVVLVAGTVTAAVSTTAAAAPPASLLISPTAFDFGPQALGSPSGPQNVSVTNVSASTVVLSGSVTDAGVFTPSSSCQGVSLAPGATCTTPYRFTPIVLGAAGASATGDWNGQTYSLHFSGSGTPRFQISPNGLDFGDVVVGTTSYWQAVNVINRGSTPIVMRGWLGVGGAFGLENNCSGDILVASAWCGMVYRFTPTTVGPVSATINGSWDGQLYTLHLTGNGVTSLPSTESDVLLTPTALDFGAQPLGGPGQTQNITVQELAGPDTVVTGSMSDPGPFGNAYNFCLGRLVSVGGWCYDFHQFTPTALGVTTTLVTGQLNGKPVGVQLTGLGTPQFRISPTGFDFGDVPVGTTSRPQVVAVVNRASRPVVMRGSGGGAGVFGGSQYCQGYTVPSGKWCFMVYQFSPTAVGPVTGTATGDWNGQPYTLTFRGNGIATP